MTYRSIRDDMIAKVNDAGWRDSKQYQKLSDFEKRLLMDFINNSTLSAYRAWIENGKTMPLEEVIEINNRIQLGGVKEFFRH